MRRRPPLPTLLASAIAACAMGCVPVQPVPVASIAGSRQLVTVSYPAEQTLRATGAGRDTVLERVSRVVGWPAGVRGDTLSLQVARWRAADRVHTMDPADRVVAVPPDAGATVTPGEHTGEGFSLLTVGALVVIGLGIALVSWWGDGPFSD